MNSPGITVTPAVTRRDRKAFIELPFDLYPYRIYRKPFGAARAEGAQNSGGHDA